MRNPSLWHLLMYRCMAIDVVRLQYYHPIMLLQCSYYIPISLWCVYNVILCYNPSQLGLWIVWSKVFQERIHMYHFDIFPKQIYMETKKQTENLLMLNSIIPKVCKRWPRNGKSQVFKIRYYWLLISFDFWILWLSILKDLLALTLQLQ